MGFNSAFKGLMTYRAKAAVCSEIRTKHSTQSEQRVEFWNVKPGLDVVHPRCVWNI